MTDNYNGQLCKTFHPRKHEALRKHSLRLATQVCAGRLAGSKLAWISRATKTGYRELWHSQDSMQRSRVNHLSIYTASQAGFTAHNEPRAAAAVLYSPIQAGYLKAEQRDVHCCWALYKAPGRTSVRPTPLADTGWFFPTGSHTVQLNNLSLLKKLKATLIVSSKALEEVILRRNHFHCNCTFNLSLGSYTIPTWTHY